MKKVFCLLILSIILLAGCATQKIISKVSNGSTLESAIVINAPNEWDGVKAESIWINQSHPGWKKGSQALLHKEGKMYDQIEYTTPEGETKTIYYDITSFYGKF
jgi:uncharacterized protein YcfL